MAFLPRPVTRMMLSMPAASASSTPYWMIGLSTSGSISLGWALVAGRNRVPRPAAGNTALQTFIVIISAFREMNKSNFDAKSHHASADPSQAITAHDFKRRKARPFAQTGFPEDSAVAP